MKELTAVVKQGRITIPKHLALPDGSVVRVVWDEEPVSAPLEAEAWTEAEVQADLRMATGQLFSE
jgi:hypothetical protein